MGKYNFDELIDRRGTHCYKWDEPAEEGIIPMWVADMDFKTAPVVIEALQRRVAQGIFGYTLVPETYYQAVISWFERRHNWTIQRPWIMYTTGVVPALSAVIKALTLPGDQVVLQTPVYNCFFSSVRNNGCEIVESPLLYHNNVYSIDYTDLEEKVKDERTKLLILCNPHNPAGRCWTRDELLRVNEICMRHHVMVVSDEIHCELTYNNVKYVPFASVSEDCLNNSVICSSPTKAFNIAGLQIANIICNNESIRERIDRAININEVCDVNPFGVEALIAAYNEGEDWLDELCSYIYTNYETMKTYLAEHHPQLKVLALEATYLAWIDISALGVRSDDLTNRLLTEGKVMVNSGTMYGSTDGEGFIRLNLACPRARMMEGLQRISKIINQQ